MGVAILVQIRFYFIYDIVIVFLDALSSSFLKKIANTYVQSVCANSFLQEKYDVKIVLFRIVL